MGRYIFITSPQLRGTFALASIVAVDHRNLPVNFVEGDFDIKFNGSWFNTTRNLTNSIFVSIDLDPNLEAKDYVLEVIFNGSDLFDTSNGFGSLRVKGGIGGNWGHCSILGHCGVVGHCGIVVQCYIFGACLHIWGFVTYFGCLPDILGACLTFWVHA